MEERKTSFSLSFETRSLLADGRAGKSTLMIRGLGSSPMVKEPAIRCHVSNVFVAMVTAFERPTGSIDPQ